MKRMVSNWAIIGLLFLTGCATIGPGTIPRDRFDYTTAIGESWKNQMLLNIVKIRYGDTPVFLDVASVINQYSIQGQITLGAGWTSSPVANSQSIGGSGTYAERPTITYAPLSGEKFTRRLLTPIPPSALMFLIQAGWPVKFLFQTCVNSVNDLDNGSTSPGWGRPANPEFQRLMDALEKVQMSRALAVRVEKVDKKEAVVVIFRRKVSDEIAREISEVRKLLGLKPGIAEFSVHYGVAPKTDEQVAILTRSIFEIMVEMSSEISVPPDHVAEKRTYATSSEIAPEKSQTQYLIRVRNGTGEPTKAFSSVHYRGNWFWIDDRDRPSKVTFTFLMILLSLIETGGAPAVPPITIPVG